MLSYHNVAHHIVESLSGAALLRSLEPGMAPSPRIVMAARAAIQATTTTAAGLASGTPTLTSYSINPTDTIAPYATALNGVNQNINYLNRNMLWWSMGIFCMAVLLIRGYHMSLHLLRQISCLDDSKGTQRYWSRNSSWWYPQLKRHIIYAPLFNKRHNREFQISSAIGMGTLPSRAHVILLGAYCISNIVYCCMLNFSEANYYAKLAELRGRTGFLAVANMCPLLLLAARNNPMIVLLRVSFDNMNLFHRWIGRMVVLESLVHTLAWALVKYAAAGHSFSGIATSVTTDPFIITGLVAVILMVVIAVHALSPIRHAFYETFLTAHIIMAAVIIAGIFMHCQISNLPQKVWVEWIIFVWAAERSLRFVNVLYPNLKLRKAINGHMTRATVEAIDGSEACRVTFHLPKHISTKPGQHAYIRLAAVKPWECHPFSIAWVAEREITPPSLDFSDSSDTLVDMEKSPYNITTSSLSNQSQSTITRRSSPKPLTTTEISFIVGAKSGFTRALYNKALAAPLHTLRTRGLLEGPYAGHHSMDSYGTVLLFAGATGITHSISYLTHLLTAYEAGTIATKRIVLVWVVRDLIQLEWVRPWMDTVLRMPGRREILTVKLFVTRPKSPKDVISPSKTVQMYPGRPNLEGIVREETKSQVGAMCVSVCGPGGMCDTLRSVVREVQSESVVDFVEESFTW